MQENMEKDKTELEENERHINSGKFEKYKRFTVVGLGLITAFVIGHQSSTTSSKSEIEPTANIANKETQTDKKDDSKITTPQETVLGIQTSQTKAGESGQANCLIKGNISGKNKIYHLPGGSFYARTQAEMCFQTEAEAKTAGFRKSQR